jgi:hypothetical protein
MGYTTDFNGEFNLDKPLSEAHKNYLVKFNETRRMKRKQTVAAKMKDDARTAVDLPIGKEGAYFVGGLGMCGQDTDDSIINYNTPPSGQPGLWCGWIPNEIGTAIEWDGGEKFYEYIDWIKYLIEHFLKPWGYVLNGEVTWLGEDADDRGIIVIENNIVKIKVAKIVWEDAE